MQLGVLLLELVFVQQSVSGTPSSLTRAETLTTLALQCMTKDRVARPDMSLVAAKVYKLFLEVQDCIMANISISMAQVNSV